MYIWGKKSHNVGIYSQKNQYFTYMASHIMGGNIEAFWHKAVCPKFS